MKTWDGIRIRTIGHSTRPLDEFLALLQAFSVSILVDVRTIPRSRRNPQFNADSLRSVLHVSGLKYVQLLRLGGLRQPTRDSINTAWHNAGFRGFADHMLSEDFETGLSELRNLAEGGSVALMCAEAVPWRCHRSLISDALVVRGAEVEHITGLGHSSPHRLTEFARVQGKRVTYPGLI